MNKSLLSFILFFYFSCFYQPAINKNYNFKKVNSIEVLPINDFKGVVGSGEMIETSLDYNFLKYNFELSEKKNKKSILINNLSDQILLLSCVITNYTDSESLIIPYRDENRGYTETTVNQSREEDEESNRKEFLASSTTKTHAGNIVQGSRIEYSQSRISLIFTLKDKISGKIVWSKSSWYNGLDLQRTINMCLKENVNEIKKILK
tara:strand:- start:2228 stop:2845 length:618 start_codon:yes stop_codon:yes gene_type:complete